MTTGIRQHTVVSRPAATPTAMRAATGERPAGPGWTGTLAAQLVAAGLAATALAQGGYHSAGRVPLVLTLPPALALVAVNRVSARRGRPMQLAIAAAVALGAWGLLRGALSPVGSSGAGLAALCAGVVALLLVVRRLDADARVVLVRGLFGMGALVAAAGWVGVVGHVDELAVTLDGIWRAGSTLTYPNAAAALLTLLLLPALGLLAGRPGDRVLAALVWVLAVGHLATLSKAGLLSVGVGVAVLSALVGWRAVTRAVLAPALGAAVALAGLWGSFPLDASAGRLVAVLAAAAGLVVVLVLAPVSPPAGLVVSVAFVTVAAAAVLLRGAEVVNLRLAGGSSTRVDAHRAALQAVADDPWLGTGGEALDLGSVGRPLTVIRFVHDEYVQSLLDLGVLGLLLLLALVALLVRSAAAGSRAQPRDPLRAGVLAALVAAAVHGGLDFVWHVPVVPLTAVTLVAVVAAGDHTMRGNP